MVRALMPLSLLIRCHGEAGVDSCSIQALSIRRRWVVLFGAEAFTQKPLPLPLRVSWKWIGHNFFLEGSFFCLFSIDFDCKKRNLLSFHWWCSFSDVCRSWPRRYAKLLFFAPEVLSLGARLRPSWKKMRLEKWRSGSVRKILRLAQKRFFEPCFRVHHTNFTVSALFLKFRGFRGFRIFFFYYIISVSKHIFRIDLMPDKSWRGMRPAPVTALCISYAFPDCIRTLCKLFHLL